MSSYSVNSKHVMDTDNQAIQLAYVFDMIQTSLVQSPEIIQKVYNTVYSPHTLSRFFAAIKQQIVEYGSRSGIDDITSIWHSAVPTCLNVTEPGRIDTNRTFVFIDQLGLWPIYVAFAHNLHNGVGEIDPISSNIILARLGIVTAHTS